MVVDPHQRSPRIYKVIVIGNSAVGKTSLTYRLCDQKFLTKSEATIGVDFRIKKIQVDGEEVTLQLWDTAGEERFRNSMVRQYYRNTHAIVLVYAVSNRNSFRSLQKWVEECEMNCVSDIPKILIGNKCDETPVITTQEAQKFADECNMLLFETSAKMDMEYDNIEAIFTTLAHKLKNQKSFRPNVPQGRTLTAVVNDRTSTTGGGGGCC